MIPLARRSVRWLSALLMAVAGLGCLSGPAAAQGLGGLRGERLAEADLAQGTTIVVVWASWSPHSRDIVERVNPIASRWGGQARVVTVNFQEDRGAVERFLSGKNLSAPVFLDTDGSFSKKHTVVNLPGLLILRDGQPVFRGKLPDDPDRVIADALR